MLPDDPNTIYAVVGVGQSLALGVSSTDTLMSTATPYPDDALMFDLAEGNPDVRMGIPTASSTLEAVDGDNLVGFTPLKAVNYEGLRGETP